MAKVRLNNISCKCPKCKQKLEFDAEETKIIQKESFVTECPSCNQDVVVYNEKGKILCEWFSSKDDMSFSSKKEYEEHILSLNTKKSANGFKFISILIVAFVLIFGIVYLINAFGKECPTSCDDGIKCTIDSCSKGTNYECVNTPIIPCKGNSVCEKGEFGSSDCPSCDDGDSCTKNSINYTDLECVNTAITPCKGNSVCEKGEFGSSDCPSCDDGDSCTIDSINYTNLECVNEPIIPCCGNKIKDQGETCSSCNLDVKCPIGTKCCSNSCKDICNKDSDCRSISPLETGYCENSGTCDSKCMYAISSAALILKAKTVPYDDLFRYNEEYVGTPVKYVGEIIQVGGSSDNKYFRIDVTKTSFSWGDYYDDTIYAFYDGSKRFLDDDIVELYGIVTGIQSYTSIMGALIEIPEVKIYVIELVTKAGDRD